MGLAKVLTATQLGVAAHLVEVEVHVSRGLPGFDIVGLPHETVKEGRKRIRSAIISSAFEFPLQKITVNLAPADLKKGGSRFDLPIAVGILMANGQLPAPAIENRLLIGELALDGNLRPVSGGLAALKLTHDLKMKSLELPGGSDHYFGLLSEQAYCTHSNLRELVETLREGGPTRTAEDKTNSKLPLGTAPVPNSAETMDLKEIQGQEVGKRAIIVAAAGFHSLLLTGPAGVGKTLLAKALPNILPRLSASEAVEVAMVHSSLSADLGRPIHYRPFRSPHHSLTMPGLLGKCLGTQPGEVALAHHGVLFMDEFPEFRRDLLEALREPLEQGCYQLIRSWGEVRYPSRFMLIAAMNPCPCGHFGDPQHECSCAVREVQRYQNKLSGPILDRIDLQIQLNRTNLRKLPTTPPGLSTEQAALLVERATQMQNQRFQQSPYRCNADIRPQDLPKYCAVKPIDQEFLLTAMEKLQFSHRAYHRILKVSRTIADLDGAEAISRPHLLEALQYRRRRQVLS